MQQLIMPSRSNVCPRPFIAGWRMTSRELQACRQHVTLNLNAIPALLPWIAPGPPNEAWRGYVGEIDPVAPNLVSLFHELAQTITQFGGMNAFRPDGSFETWKKDGSGVKAVLATMDRIRADKKRPGIDIFDHYDRELAHYFIDVPFGAQRLAMLKELGAPEARGFFERHLRPARRRDGSYCFTVLHMIGLGLLFPKSFGSDPLFCKKGSLLLMTMEIALKQLGHRAVSLTPPPADYQIPRILEGLGILRLADELSDKVRDGHIFKLDDAEVRAIRAMTIEAVGHIRQAYERQHATRITCAEIDGLLYLLSRNRPLMTRTTMKPHMLVATAAF